MVTHETRMIQGNCMSCRPCPRPAQPIGPVALSGKYQIKAAGSAQARVEVHMGVNGPEDGGAQLGRQAVVEAIVDIEIKVTPLAWDMVELIGLEMGDVDESFQGAPAVDAGCLGPSPVIENHRNATDCHRCALV